MTSRKSVQIYYSIHITILTSLFVRDQEVGNVGDLRGDMIFRGHGGLKNRLVCNWFSVKVNDDRGC